MQSPFIASKGEKTLITALNGYCESLPFCIKYFMKTSLRIRSNTQKKRLCQICQSMLAVFVQQCCLKCATMLPKLCSNAAESVQQCCLKIADVLRKFGRCAAKNRQQ